jgi:hypothetical protein
VVASGCATTRPPPDSYLSGFVERAAEHGVSVDAQSVEFRFVPTIQSEAMEGGHPDAAAVCDRRQPPHIVYVSKAFWGDDYWSEASHRAVVYHELGHCLLGLGHDRSEAGGKPRSLMYPEMFGGQVYAQNEADYLDRLFAAATLARKVALLMEALEIP